MRCRPRLDAARHDSKGAQRFSRCHLRLHDDWGDSNCRHIFIHLRGAFGLGHLAGTKKFTTIQETWLSLENGWHEHQDVVMILAGHGFLRLAEGVDMGPC